MPSTSQETRTDNPIKNVQQVVSSIQKFEFPHKFEVESFKTMGISIQMDFSETLSEISISSAILENLRKFFQTEESLNLKVIISDISKSNPKTLRSTQYHSNSYLLVPLMNLTMMKFMSKNPIFKILNCQDQLTITQENFYLVFHFCIFKFATSLSADDQFSWLVFRNIPKKGNLSTDHKMLAFIKESFICIQFL